MTGFLSRAVDGTITKRIGYRGKLLTVYYHRYSDEDWPRENALRKQTAHSHPWRWNITIVLTGWLFEWLLDAPDRAFQKVRWFALRPGHERHVIADWAPGTRTLFIGWRREGAGVVTLDERRRHGACNMHIEGWPDCRLYHWSEFAGATCKEDRLLRNRNAPRSCEDAS